MSDTRSGFVKLRLDLFRVGSGEWGVSDILRGYASYSRILVRLSRPVEPMRKSPLDLTLFGRHLEFRQLGWMEKNSTYDA